MFQDLFYFLITLVWSNYVSHSDIFENGRLKLFNYVNFIGQNDQYRYCSESTLNLPRFLLSDNFTVLFKDMYSQTAKDVCSLVSKQGCILIEVDP